jgi:hypothetical protein
MVAVVYPTVPLALQCYPDGWHLSVVQLRSNGTHRGNTSGAKLPNSRSERLGVSIGRRLVLFRSLLPGLAKLHATPLEVSRRALKVLAITVSVLPHDRKERVW